MSMYSEAPQPKSHALRVAVNKRFAADPEYLALLDALAAVRRALHARQDAIVSEEKTRLRITGQTEFEALMDEGRLGLG